MTCGSWGHTLESMASETMYHIKMNSGTEYYS